MKIPLLKMEAGLIKEFFINWKPDSPVAQLSRDLNVRYLNDGRPTRLSCSGSDKVISGQIRFWCGITQPSLCSISAKGRPIHVKAGYIRLPTASRTNQF